MYAAALETKSSHPVASAIVNHFSGCITDKIEEFGSHINLPEVRKFKNESGMGLSGIVRETDVLVGNLDLMKLYNVTVEVAEMNILNDWSSAGKTVVFVAIENKVSFFLLLGLFFGYCNAPFYLQVVIQKFCLAIYNLDFVFIIRIFKSKYQYELFQLL